MTVEKYFKITSFKNLGGDGTGCSVKVYIDGVFVDEQVDKSSKDILFYLLTKYPKYKLKNIEFEVDVEEGIYRHALVFLNITIWI